MLKTEKLNLKFTLYFHFAAPVKIMKNFPKQISYFLFVLMPSLSLSLRDQMRNIQVVFERHCGWCLGWRRKFPREKYIFDWHLSICCREKTNSFYWWHYKFYLTILCIPCPSHYRSLQEYSWNYYIFPKIISQKISN